MIGDLFDDLIVRPTGPIRPDTDTLARIERRNGGAAANVATWLGWLGSTVDFVGTVGAADAARHTAALGAGGVRAHLRSVSEPTGTIVVIVEHGQRTMLTSPGANTLTSPADVSDELLEGAGHLHLTGYSLFGQPSAVPHWHRLVDRAHGFGLTVSMDPGSVGFLDDFGPERFLSAVEGVDLLLPNRDEGAALAGSNDASEIVAVLLKRFEVVAMTLGAAGAIAAARGDDDGRAQRVSAVVPTALVDTTGAGDAFTAGFLSAWTSGAGTRAAATLGVRCAALAVSTPGARPGGFLRDTPDRGDEPHSDEEFTGT